MAGEIEWDQMDEEGVASLLMELSMAEYVQDIKARKLTGKRLSYCRTFEDVVQLGITANADAGLLFDVINRKKKKCNTYINTYMNTLNIIVYIYTKTYIYLSILMNKHKYHVVV